MTELSFAKSFLATLDSRTIKLQSDHAADPKTFEPKGPYTLPRTSQPMRRRDPTSAPPATPDTLTITLKSLRSPPINLTLPSQSFSTSIIDLKSAIAKEVKAKGIDGIKILYNKKPCADSKTVKDVLGDGEVPTEVEFGVMIMSGVVTGVEGKEAEGGDEVLESEEFWNDLKGFLGKRLGDEGKAEQLVGAFRGSYKGKSGGGGWKWGGMGMKGWSK